MSLSVGEFETLQGRTIGFDIQDVSGGYVYEFPGMMNVSLASADAFILVFSIDSNGSWEEVARLRDIIQTSKGNQVKNVYSAYFNGNWKWDIQFRKIQLVYDANTRRALGSHCGCRQQE